MLFSEKIKREVYTRACEMALNHTAVAKAKAGKVETRSVANYLASVHFLLSQTIPHLERARARAARLAQPELVSFLEKKLAEEVGHEKWAEDDIRELARRNGDAIKGCPLPAIVELVQFLAELTERDPRLYVVYVLSNEYFTVLAGPAWIDALTTHCGVPNAALTAASKHVEADQAHAAQGFAEIDKLITDPMLGPAVAGTVDRTMCLFDQFFQEVIAAKN